MPVVVGVSPTGSVVAFACCKGRCSQPVADQAQMFYSIAARGAAATSRPQCRSAIDWHGREIKIADQRSALALIVG